MTDAASIEIACLCGAVALGIRGEPSQQFYCHCDDCQAISGGAYVSVALFPADAVTVIRGQTAVWTYKTLPRHRCTVCGTAMMAEVTAFDQVGIGGHKLPAHMFKPEFHIQCRYAQLPVTDGLPHYVSVPELFGGTDEQVAW